MKVRVIIKKKSACGSDIDEGLFDAFKRKKKDAESDFLYSGPVAPEMPREAKNNPDIVRKTLEILEDEPEGMSYTDLMAVLEKNTNASIHEDIPETLKNLPDFFRDEERNFIIPDEMRKRHKRWRSLNMENIFESFRRYLTEEENSEGYKIGYNLLGSGDKGNADMGFAVWDSLGREQVGDDVIKGLTGALFDHRENGEELFSEKNFYPGSNSILDEFRTQVDDYNARQQGLSDVFEKIFNDPDWWRLPGTYGGIMHVPWDAAKEHIMKKWEEVK